MSLIEEKLPISCLIVTHNECDLIEDCIKSILFCNEIVLIDLESKDNTIEVVQKYNCLILNEKKVDMVEQLFPKYIPKLRNDWVLLIDPDERVDLELQKDIRKFFENIPEDCGKINVPIVYYYKNKPLLGTIWGGNKSGRLLIRKSGCKISNNVHNAIELLPDKLVYRIKRFGNNVDHHFWVQSYQQMLEKHKRYIENEGKAKYEKGERFTYIRAIKVTFSSFWNCLFKYKGYKDGLLGLFLSGFYAWYNWSSWISLKRYQFLLNNKK